MAIEGITFDLMRVTPADDALLYDALGCMKDRVISGYADELKLTTSGLNVYVGKGAAVVKGRIVRLTEQERISVPANSSGHICFTIDLTQTNSFTGTPGSTDYLPVNNQVRLEALTGSLVQQDLHTNGKVYSFPLAKFTSTGSAVTITMLHGFESFTTLNSNFSITEVRVSNGIMTFYFKAKRHAALEGLISDLAILPENYRPKLTHMCAIGSLQAIRRLGVVKIEGSTGKVSWYGFVNAGTPADSDYGGYITVPI